ncbi:hypothetical protein [Lentzea cavernae]|uniref:DUF2892 domain-containing protein n=1 Tax=Lentzea cavernae TaxID=2020703 RepID=A0ABQ3M2N0_9PSEU|nr:hypothetical protein [Lentzea cavernae]GHH27813.1 hypothetical protein GCM10017774_00990 [Lentzea cavernae]
MSTLRHAPVVARMTTPAQRGDDSPLWQPNRRSVRYAVDLLGALIVVAGFVSGEFALGFGGAVVLLAGMCLHVSCGRQGVEGR